jgi:hypothetical protein
VVDPGFFREEGSKKLYEDVLFFEASALYRLGTYAGRRCLKNSPACVRRK